MAITRGPRITRDGLVLTLDAADRNSYPGSGVTWYDLSGNGNHGTLNGSTFDSNNGGSLFLDGTDDYIDVGSFTFNSSSVYTASFWIKLSNNTTQQYLLDLRNTDIAGGGAVIAYNQNGTGGKIHYTVFGGGSPWPSAPTVLSLSTWFNIAVIHNSLTNNLKIYINSLLDLNTTFSSDLTVASSPLRIGARRFIQSSPTNGNISQVSIYNRALSTTEIQQNYNTTKSRFNL